MKNHTQTGSLLPKCNALQRLNRHIDRMRCLNATLFARFSKAAEKQCGNVVEFLGSILHHRAAIGIR